MPVRRHVSLRLALTQLEKRLAPALVVNTAADDGPGSLRVALLAANNDKISDTVAINILVNGPIQVTSSLPTISRKVAIDGTAAPSGHAEIRGNLAGSVNGLVVGTGAASCQFKGLVI